MNLVPVKLPLIKLGDNFLKILIKVLKRKKIGLVQGDIIVITSKVIALSQGRVVRLKKISQEKLTPFIKKYELNPKLAKVILKEAQKIVGGVPKAVLTLKEGILVANAGLDCSNAPPDVAILWPKDPKESAEKIKNTLEEEFKVEIGVIVTDSSCRPLRQGTTGLALAIAGFQGVVDERGSLDLFGKRLKITLKNMADDLASAAHLLMGEAKEKIPVVVIREAPITLSKKKAKPLSEELVISPQKCIFRNYKL